MNIAMILAGGQGLRMNTDKPKQFLTLGKKPVIIHTISAFESCSHIDAICIVCLREYFTHITSLLNEYCITKVKWLAQGGCDRRLSALYGLRHISNDVNGDDIVLIHDAARPNVSPRIIFDNINSAREHGACETVIPSQDTVIESIDGARLTNIPPRKNIYIVQTPQSFRFDIIYPAHVKYADDLVSSGASSSSCVLRELPDITDDAGVVRYYGKDVFLVRGDKMNIKITQPEDLRILKSFI